MANFTLQDLQDQNDLLLSQLEITRMNSDELREQMSLIKKIYGDNTVGKEQQLKINQLNRELSNINKSLIDQLKERNNLERSTKDISKDLIRSKKIQQSLETEIGELEKKSVGLSKSKKANIDNLLNGLKAQLDAQQEINKSLEEEERLTNIISNKMGMIPSIADGISQSLNRLGFSSLSKRLDIEGAIQNTKEWLVANDGNKNSFQVISKFSGNLLGNISKTLGPTVLIGGAIAMIVKSMMSFDDMAGNTAKSFGTSYEEASKINQKLTQIASTTSNNFVTTKSLVEAQNSLNSSLGTNAQFSGELLTTYTELTKQAGYSVETAETLSKLSLVTNKSSEDLTTTYLGQVKALNLKNGLAINEKALLNDISNVSKATLVTFSKNPAELAKAAFEAKKIGLELKQIEGIQSSLLDIESSIASEFEAEVMTGKALNLERARYYALTNDISGLAQELNKQNITSTSFGKMNVLQQEAQAKALGMSREEMGKMLIEQDALSKLGMTDNEENRKKLQYLKDHGGNLSSIVELGKEEYDKQLKSVTTQERFLALTEKLQEVFISIAGPLMDIVSPLMTLVSTVITPIANGFTSIKEIISSILDPTKSLSETLANMGPLTAFIAGGLTAAGVAVTASLVPGLIRTAAAAAMALPSMISMAVAAISTASATTLGIGAIAIIGGIAAAVAAMNSAKSSAKMDDGIVGPDGGMILSGPKGSIQLNKNDSVVAGTNLFDKGDSKNNNDSNISVLSSTLGNKMDVMINKLDNLITAVNKGMTVNLDGNKVSQNILTPLAINNRNI